MENKHPDQKLTSAMVEQYMPRRMRLYFDSNTKRTAVQLSLGEMLIQHWTKFDPKLHVWTRLIKSEVKTLTPDEYQAMWELHEGLIRRSLVKSDNSNTKIQHYKLGAN